ncbi:glycine betaine ABC transporter substrate-binding protein [Paenibacillus sp. J2TS4]|uniref:glycine betaine ABC transporter substrate-binding protein n=1 Tax=Paenibacillus sp. J2TS4 TaxID=2807194 RepID=UPI001B0A7076|nr:glycine betaine ABC transporter substrate-binding protein [Paenibacillus sp. J2TS4]GIP35698.1 glycine betaine/carnitine/choline-binding protein OpuCC [Paenibacillus sp. J2TS4]
MKAYINKPVGFLLLLALLAGVSGCGRGNQIIIGAQTYTEAKIIATMYQILIEEQTNLRVRTMPDLASSPVIINAMKNNDVQMATLYTGEIFNNHFPVQEGRGREQVLQQAKDGFDEYFNFKWFDPYGFENTYAFTVRQAEAEKYQLEQISDLHDVASTMRLGVDMSWLERSEDGYRAFSEQYGIQFGETFPMEIGLVYEAVAHNNVDIVLAYSTDPRLKEFNLTTLKDDKQFFPPYDASPVIKKEVLEQHPELNEIIEQLVGKIDGETMTSLNYEVDINKRSEKAVAREFLKEIGLLK